MKKQEFYKLQASGNDFILIENSKLQAAGCRPQAFAKKYCERKLGIGADGLLVIEPSKKCDFKMRVFNSDGSEAEMCGNGARCAALWAAQTRDDIFVGTSRRKTKDDIEFETKAGTIEAQVKGEKVRIKISDPFGLKLNVPLKVLGRNVKVNFINTGVPHTVIFVESLDKIDINNIGRAIRCHKKFSPKGTNVNFVEIKNSNSVKVRTYERGVEDETLACGTGAAASAIVSVIGYRLSVIGDKLKSHRYKMEVLTMSKEALTVYFDIDNEKINDVWLKGKAHFVYKGGIC